MDGEDGCLNSQNSEYAAEPAYMRYAAWYKNAASNAEAEPREVRVGCPNQSAHSVYSQRRSARAVSV